MSQVSTGKSSISGSIQRWLEMHAHKPGIAGPELQRVFFSAALLVYALLASIGIDRFPIYFFTDEAAHMNMAADFLHSGFKNYYGEFLPTFFTAEGWVNGTSVYVQLIPYLIFGKSVLVSRLVSAFITLLGAAAIGLLLKKAFKLKYYWTGILLLIITPAWFLHARTAFEYAEVGSFYAIFLYFYARYRKGDLRCLYFAVFSGALCFYTHGLGEILMGVTALALFCMDFRYHFDPRRRKTILLGFGFAVLLALPFVRYYLAHPNESADQVARRGSYWASASLGLFQKMTDFVTQYTYGLNPLYWYFPNGVDLERHRMLGFFYGNGLWPTLPLELVGLFQILRSVRHRLARAGIILLLACPIVPSTIIIGLGGKVAWTVGPSFSIPLDALNSLLWISTGLMLLGVFLALRNIRMPAHRLALIVLLACPIPASIAAIGMPRMLWFSIPMAILCAIGLSAVAQWVETRGKTDSTRVAWSLFAVLTLVGAFILRDALVNGPTWFQDYGLYGMQYGAPQVFGDTVVPELQKNPQLHVVVSPSWANGTQQFIPFFIPPNDQSRVSFGEPGDFIDSLAAGAPELEFIVTAAEYDQLEEDLRPLNPSADYDNSKLWLFQGMNPSGNFNQLSVEQRAALPKYKQILVHKLIPYPNGHPGFYLISLIPADHLKEIAAAIHEQNRTPIEDTMRLNGETIRVVHSPLGAGHIADSFDNDPNTFTRGLEANPYLVYLYPPTPLDTHQVFIETGAMPDFTVTIRLYAPGSGQPVQYSQTYQGAGLNPEITISFDQGPAKSAQIEIEIKNNLSGESAQIHVRTIQFR